MNNQPYDIAIVGAGAAGMTAALYALRAKKSVLLLEKLTPGGQILKTHKIDNFPAAPGISGAEFAQRLRSQVEGFSGQFSYANVVKITTDDSASAPLFRLETDDPDVSPVARSVILALGSAERKLDLPEESRFIGHGVSYCATCDGAFFRDKSVAVYGAGNTALYSVLYLANFVKKVYLVNHSSRYKADKSLVEKARSLDNVEFLENTEITALAGAPSLKEITLKTVDSAKTSSLPVSGLFVSIGRIPDNAFLRGFVDLDSQGYIESSESCQTSRPGIFCAGDCRKKLVNQLTTAVADGAVAATQAVAFLNSQS